MELSIMSYNIQQFFSSVLITKLWRCTEYVKQQGGGEGDGGFSKQWLPQSLIEWSVRRIWDYGQFFLHVLLLSKALTPVNQVGAFGTHGSV